MTGSVITAIVSTGGAVIVGLGGMWIGTQQIGKRMDDLARRFERFENDLRTVKNVVSGRLASLDTGLARLVDRPR